MPAWNESEGLIEFVTELRESFSNIQVNFCIVNDNSLDATEDKIIELKKLGYEINSHTNIFNLGHGPSTMIALKLGLRSHAEYILAIDGDGQFIGYEVALLYSAIKSGKFDLVEGVRMNRNDPLSRKFISLVTRYLIFFRTGCRTLDANTPLRLYKKDSLALLLESMPPTSLIPNLHLSTLSRKMKLRIGFVNVSSIPRRGTNPIGTTWGKSSFLKPNTKLFKFCYAAAKEWFSFKV